VTDNTYSLASQLDTVQPIPHQFVHFTEAIWKEAQAVFSKVTVQMSITRDSDELERNAATIPIAKALTELHKSADSAHLAASTECARANKAEGELAEARSLLDAISNSTEHADAAQTWAMGKAELLEVMRSAKLQLEYLHGKFRETGSGNQTLARLESTIAKYEAK
jgi:hypothetical protein